MTAKDEALLSDLLRSAISGDEEAYANFMKLLLPLIRSFARRRVSLGGVEPEDIVQETLLAIHLKRHTWLTNAPVLPWVYAIARYKLVDAFRRRGKQIEIDLDEIRESYAQPTAEMASSRDVQRVLNTLPDGQRTIVASISIDGCSIGETARKLSMSEGAVRVALHRGLATISKKFGQV